MAANRSGNSSIELTGGPVRIVSACTRTRLTCRAMQSVESASSLPAKPTQLVGRTRELLGLRELVLRDDVRLVTITGTAGIGKTRLAIASASDLHSAFAEGAAFVDLSCVSDATRALATIGTSLGLPEISPAASFERVREILRDRAQLLVLDN